jgi:hypothetical protein
MKAPGELALDAEARASVIRLYRSVGLEEEAREVEAEG